MSALFIICLVGILACVTLDFWQRVIFMIVRVPPTNWALVGRWVIILIKYKVWVQNSLSQQIQYKNELVIGWCFHYIVAIAYALFYFFLSETGLVAFNLFDGAVFGMVSVVVPWFFFMPAMGSGFLGNKTPNPFLACTLALVAHTIFGGAIGLFFSFFY